MMAVVNIPFREAHLSSNGRCFDIGNTVMEAFLKFEKTGEPTHPRSAGNDSIMRLAPIPLFFVHKPWESIVRSGESSRTTHGAASAVDACRYFGALLVGAVNGIERSLFLLYIANCLALPQTLCLKVAPRRRCSADKERIAVMEKHSELGKSTNQLW
jgi:ADP-ribosylglycohydrolase